MYIDFFLSSLLENLSFLGIAILLAFLATIFWLAFYYNLSKKLTTSQNFLIKILILGIGTGVITGILEVGFLTNFLPEKILSIFGQEKIIFTLSELLSVLTASFLFIALPEELLKFLFLKKAIFRSPHLNQTIDGVKIGIVLGLGFGTIENTFIFFKQLPNFSGLPSILTLFLMRLLVPTLAHSLYGAVMGYYLSLAKFYKIFQQRFLWQAIMVPFLLHGFFNFLLFSPFMFLVAFLLISTLLIVLKWYLDRENFQIMLSKEPSKKISPPTFTESQEMQALIFKNLTKFQFLKKFGICPFCFKKLEIIKGNCSYCERSISY